MLSQSDAERLISLQKKTIGEEVYLFLKEL